MSKKVDNKQLTGVSMSLMSRALFAILMTVLFLFIQGVANADEISSGSITGQLVDSQTGEPLIGATILIETTKMGAASDINGKFTISNVPAGTYDLLIRYIGYSAVTVQKAEVKPGLAVELDMALTPDAIQGQDVIVEARAVRNNDASLLKNRQKSQSISDAISAESISRTGSGDAADAIKKITGASVVGGKYIYIRGLGDRYSNAQLNGTDLPSADPDKKAFQMDLLPSDFLENIIVSKSFTPEKPGDFSGGSVNINTKSFPETFTLKVSSSTGYNSRGNLNDEFLTYNGGGSDWVGMDDGSRAIPDDLNSGDIPHISFAFNDPELANQLDKLTKSFNSNMAPVKKAKPLNQSYSIATGNKVDFLGKELGFLASLSYSNKYSLYENGEVGKYRLSGSTNQTYSLTNDYKLTDTKGSSEVLWGGLMTASCKLNNENELGFNFIHTQSGESATRYLTGQFFDGNLPQNAIYQTRVLQYTERSLNSTQLSGKHYLGLFSGMNVKWSGTYSANEQDEPDVRYFSNHYIVTESDTFYTIRPSMYQVPQRHFRNMQEDSYNFDTKASIPYIQWSGLSGKFDFGAYFSHKDRSFRQRVFEIQNQDVNAYNGDANEYFSDSNSGIIDSTGGFYTFGNYVVENSELRANYDGDLDVIAGFAMIDMPLMVDLRFIGGLRVEKTDMEVQTWDNSYDPGILDDMDLLPSAGLVYQLSENMNLRTSYGRTLARPTFRELAPFPSYDYANGNQVIGNPNLERTLIDNVDFRWEWFDRPGEIIAASVFGKQFRNPIERTIINDNGEIQYTNVDEARVYGVEFEMRKKLDVIHTMLSNFQLGANLSLIRSEVDIPEEEMNQISTYDENADDTRPLQGQSPYLLNIDLSYNNHDTRTVAGLSFNVFGERISEVSKGGTPDVYEQPQPSLNLLFSQNLIGGLGFKFSAKNIFDSSVKKVHHFKGNDFIKEEYKYGRSFSFGLSYNIS